MKIKILCRLEERKFWGDKLQFSLVSTREVQSYVEFFPNIGMIKSICYISPYSYVDFGTINTSTDRSRIRVNNYYMSVAG